MNPPSGSRKKRRKNADSAHLISTSSHPIPIKIPSILISSELHTRLLVGREFNFSYISGLNILNIKWLLLQTGVACKTVKPGIATGLISPKKKCMPETKVPIFHWLFWPIQLKRKGSLCKIYQHIIWKQRSNLFNWKNRGGFLVTEKNPKIQPRYVRSCGCVTYFGGSSSSSKDSDISSHIIWNLNRDLKLFASPAPEWSSPGQPSIALDLQIEFDWMHHSNSKLQKARAPNRWLFLAAAPFVLYCLIYKSVQLQTKVGTTCTQKKSNHVSIRILARAKEHDCKAKLSMMEFVFARGCFSKTQTFETCVFRYECQRCLIRIDMPAIVIPKLTYWLSNMSKQRPRVSLPWGGWPSAWPRGVGKDSGSQLNIWKASMLK